MKKHLIIGGGLAGCSLAWWLAKKGHNVRLIDNNKNKSSFVAAGMINPIVFRRVNKSWRVDDFLPSAIRFYQKIERETDSKFFNTIKIRRFFASDQEKKYWIQKQQDSEYVKYLSPPDENNYEFTNDKNTLGSGIVKNAYRVNASSFMKEIHNMLQSQGILSYQEFHQEKINAKELAYNGETYQSIVFSCGSDQNTISLFNEVEIQQTKGQILTIKSEQMTEEEAWNHKGFILPIGSNLFKAGATIEWDASDTKTTEKGKRNLINVIGGIFSGSYTVDSQIAGIRPTVHDRRPVMGEHPKYKGFYLFNGLGTKGYLMAPLLAEEMADYLISGKELHKEVQLSRFYKNKG